jgi:hypothetical protein
MPLFSYTTVTTGGGGGGGGGSAHAAEVIVDPAGGGDAPTIAGGLALIPAGGGRIYVRAGAYAESGLTLPDSNVTFTGSGRGNTTITPGAGLSAFTIPGSVTAGRRYVFEDITVAGSATGETYLTVSQDVNIISQRVEHTNMRFSIDRSGFFDPLTFTFIDSQLGLDGNASASFHRSFGGNSFARWFNVDADVNGNGGQFGNPGSGGELIVRNSRLFGATVSASVNWSIGGEIHIDGFVANRMRINPSGTDNVTINDFHTTTDGRVSGGAAGMRLTNSSMLYPGQSNAFGAGSYIDNCLFDGGSGQAIAFGVPSNTVVSNCTFQNHTTRSLTVGSTASRVRIHHNRFLDAVSVVEIAGADFNLYHGNSPFPAPTILGASSLSADNIT